MRCIGGEQEDGREGQGGVCVVVYGVVLLVLRVWSVLYRAELLLMWSVLYYFNVLYRVDSQHDALDVFVGWI